MSPTISISYKDIDDYPKTTSNQERPVSSRSNFNLLEKVTQIKSFKNMNG